VDQQKLEKSSPGCIIFSQSTSYLNLFWLEAAFTPIYVVPFQNGEVSKVSFATILRSILLSKGLGEGKEVYFSEDTRTAKVPIVIFPEAAPSNGDTLLIFRPFCGTISERRRVHVLGFAHSRSGVGPSFVAGSFFKHLLLQGLLRLRSRIQIVALENKIELTLFDRQSLSYLYS
jgi:hypothetical protein